MVQMAVIALRLIIPLSILRFPLAGALMVILIDYFDWEIIHPLHIFSPLNYQIIDKLLDTYYLTLEMVIAFVWKNRLASLTALVLFVWRYLGFILFSATGEEWYLVLFPNLFEAFFLFYLGFQFFFKRDPFTSVKGLLLILVLMLIPKLIHEYFLHINTANPWHQNHYIQYLLSSNPSI